MNQFYTDENFECTKRCAKDLFLKSEYLKRFNNYISIAKDIFSYPFSEFSCPVKRYQLSAINKIIRILSLDIQNSIIEHVLNYDISYEYNPIIDDNFLRCHKCFKIHHYERRLEKITSPIAFNISKHPTISSPWDIDRFIDALGTIGNSVDNPFKFDPGNHFDSILVLPINLLIIKNGYHSSTSGIYDENAIYYPSHQLDITDWYKEIYFDGIFFRHKPCDSILISPDNKSIGIIYEIGRILYEHEENLVSLHI